MFMNMEEFKNMSVPDIVRHLNVGCGEEITVDFKKIACKLEVSILPRDFSDFPIPNEKPLCAFVTNEQGNSAFFYDVNLLVCKERSLWRVVLAQAIAKYIVTGEKSFFVMESTEPSGRESQLMYELLMPEDKVHAIIEKLILPTTLSLGDVFSVPRSFLIERLRNLKNKPQKYIGDYDY